MPRKKSKPAAKANPPAEPKTLTKVQLTYLRVQMDKAEAEEIAADLMLPVARVRREIEKARAADLPPRDAPPAAPVPAPPPSRACLDRFSAASSSTGQPVQGVAVMTPQQSMEDDIKAGTSPFGSAQVSEAVRDYVRRNMDSMSVERIAQETGLAPFQVRAVIDHLRGVSGGREQFFERNRGNLHKIRPGEPIR